MNWDLPKQTWLIDAGRAPGDCWRCCIAAILQKPAREVPHFQADALRDNRSMDAITQTWLNARGWCLIHCRSLAFPRYHGSGFDGLPVISCGPTERSRGLGKHHAIITIAGKMVYDPHPSNAGLTAVTDEYVVVPIPHAQPPNAN